MTYTIADVSQAAREVAIVAAAALIRTGGNADAATEMLAEFSAKVPPEGDELDASAIAAQAIRTAVELGVTPA